MCCKHASSVLLKCTITMKYIVGALLHYIKKYKIKIKIFHIYHIADVLLIEAYYGASLVCFAHHCSYSKMLHICFQPTSSRKYSRSIIFIYWKCPPRSIYGASFAFFTRTANILHMDAFHTYSLHAPYMLLKLIKT